MNQNKKLVKQAHLIKVNNRKYQLIWTNAIGSQKSLSFAIVEKLAKLKKIEQLYKTK